MAFGADISETLGNVGNRATAQGYNKPDEIRKQYTGYEHDDESGLDFAQARYYNSSHGRFTSIDPLTASANVKDPQTFNRLDMQGTIVETEIKSTLEQARQIGLDKHNKAKKRNQ